MGVSGHLPMATSIINYNQMIILSYLLIEESEKSGIIIIAWNGIFVCTPYYFRGTTGSSAQLILYRNTPGRAAKEKIT